MLKVQEYLKTKSLNDLKKNHGINHRIVGHKVGLNYDQLEAKTGDRLAEECRGLILRKEDGSDILENVPLGNSKILACPFFRFYNVQEHCAAEIDWETASVQEKLDGCFLSDTTISCWDGSTITIGEIVKEGKRPTLIGMKDGTLVPSEIVNVFDNGKKDNWLEIEVDFGTPYKKKNNSFSSTKNSKIKVTSNHSIFLNNKFDIAEKAKPGDVVNTFCVSPDENVIKIAKASLLGDGSISNGIFQERHSFKQKKYLLWKKNFFGECSIADLVERVSGYGSKVLNFNSLTFDVFRELRRDWYKPNKKIPEDLSWIDNFTVAVWYMDDGSLSRNKNQKDRACFATNGFSKSDCERLALRLENMYEVSCTVYNSKGWNIRINSGKNNEISNFWNSISEYIIPSMEYKLPENFRGKEKNYILEHRGSIEKVLKKGKIISIKKVKDLSKNTFPFGRKGFDIETSTNNYFAKGMLVHNSMCIMYFDDVQGKWHIATRSVPEANLPITGFDFTFRSLFEKALYETVGAEGLESAPRVDEQHTYIFELTSPYNRIVVSYPETRITLIGIRHNETLKEISPYNQGFYPVPKRYSLNNLNDIMTFVNSQDPTQQEGVVIIDNAYSRVKVKSLSYVAFNKARDKLGASLRNCLILVMEDKVDDCIGKLPKEIEDILLDMRDKLSDFVKLHEMVYEDAKENAMIDGKFDMKTFALDIKSRKGILTGPLFAVSRGKTNNMRDAMFSKKNNGGIDIILKGIGYE